MTPAGRDGLFLRLLLRVVDAGWWLAPPSRRREWRRQWRADIWHESRWLSRTRHGGAARSAISRENDGRAAPRVVAARPRQES